MHYNIIRGTLCTKPYYGFTGSADDYRFMIESAMISSNMDQGNTVIAYRIVKEDNELTEYAFLVENEKEGITESLDEAKLMFVELE